MPNWGHPISRRTGLLAGALAGAAMLTPRLALADAVEGPSLDQLARAKGLRFGSAIGAKNGGFDDPRYRDLVRAECALITPENELKWSVIRARGDNVFDFGLADDMLAFAEDNAMGMRGHNLLWYHPDWIQDWVKHYDFGDQPRVAAEHLIRQHIGRVCGRYRGRIFEYDVVNEAIDNTTGKLRDTVFTPHLSSQGTVDLAFRTAREADPDATLVYNDYMSWAPGDETHRNGVLRLLEGFRDRNVPVDTLGIQAHLGDPNNNETSPFGAHDEKGWRSFLDTVTDMGYGLAITEMDMSGKRLPAPVPARDRALADYARAFLDVTLSYPQVRDVVFWGIADRYNWLRSLSPRDDGAEKRPTLYDDYFRPKLMREAVAAALRAAPVRAVSGKV